jgi:hypothetical protein
MAIVNLPQGGAVNVQTPGKRAQPGGGAASQSVTKPSVARGGGPGVKGKLTGSTGKQPGRAAVGRNNYK